MTKAAKHPTPSFAHEDLVAAEPRFVYGIPKTRVVNLGKGLLLQIIPTSVAPDGSSYRLSKSFLLRYSIDGREHKVGLGPLRTDIGQSDKHLHLDDARAEAHALRTGVKRKDNPVDPLEKRRKDKEDRLKKVDGRAKTFAVVAEEYIAIHEPEWSSKAYTAQWRFTIDEYANSVIGKVRIADLNKFHVLKVLKPHWVSQNPTMQKLRARIYAVVEYAVAADYRSPALMNPADWRGCLKPLLTDPTKAKETIRPTQNHPALHYSAMPAFMARLHDKPWTSARALELAIYTAARTDEVREMTWDEVDLEGRVWTIPAARMKSDRPHEVPLSEPACALLRAIKGDRLHPTGLVFRGRKGTALASSGLKNAARQTWPEPVTDKKGKPMLGHDGEALQVTTHGFRSTFRSWAGSQTNFPLSAIEKSLAHAFGNKTERAYDRDPELEKRAELMRAWADYITAKPRDVAVLEEHRKARQGA